MDVGLVCDRCDGYSPENSPRCVLCGAPFSAASTGPKATGPAPSAAPRPSGPAPSPEVPKMEIHQTCPACGSAVPQDHRFCGKCGQRLDAPQPGAAGPQPARTMFFGAMQSPGRARLVLIKGEGLDGVSYQLNGTEHLAGRTDGAILFPEDPLLSPRHANFVVQDSQLSVRDEGSRNGVFLRLRNPVELAPGDCFLVGEQLLRVEESIEDAPVVPDAEGTFFYGSPRRPCNFKMVQVLRGGEVGVVHRARAGSVTLGREGNDMNFPDDPFISGRHARVDQVAGPAGSRFVLTDLGSKNGTFYRIKDDTALAHGDYVFLGQQLLRVEIA